MHVLAHKRLGIADVSISLSGSAFFTCTAFICLSGTFSSCCSSCAYAATALA
jgi:hypothetical protein